MIIEAKEHPITFLIRKYDLFKDNFHIGWFQFIFGQTVEVLFHNKKYKIIKDISIEKAPLLKKLFSPEVILSYKIIQDDLMIIQVEIPSKSFSNGYKITLSFDGRTYVISLSSLWSASLPIQGEIYENNQKIGHMFAGHGYGYSTFKCKLEFYSDVPEPVCLLLLSFTTPLYTWSWLLFISLFKSKNCTLKSAVNR